MGSKTESSDAELDMLFRDICRHAPGFSPPSNPHTITPPALDLNPAYSNSPSTLDLVLRYFRYNVYAPLFYLALVKLLVGDDDDDDDDRKPMTMLAPELADGSPFGDMSAAQLLEVIRQKLGLLQNELTARKSELAKELTSMKQWRRVWSEADWALSILLAVINSAALVAAMVMPASVTATLLFSLAAGNLLVSAATKTVGWWLGMTDDERESQLESQKDVIEAMLRELLLSPDLGKIGSLLENLKKERVQMQAANHLEREAEEKKKKVKKAIKNVRKTVDQVEGAVKKAATKFVRIIRK